MQKRLEEGVDGRVWLAPAVSFFVTASVVLVAFALGSFAPFGTADNSLASMDGFIQYLDFFAWYKDLLAGNNDIAYSFSKMLGGGTRQSSPTTSRPRSTFSSSSSTRPTSALSLT